MRRLVGRHQGRDVVEAVLENNQQRVHILNYGNVVRRWLVGENRDIVLGFDAFADYLEHSRSFGIIAGRVANRTRRGQFELLGQRHQVSINHGSHHLHGGITGLGERIWEMDTDSAENRVQLNYFSPHNEEGYPANVKFTVTWSLTEDGLHCLMQGMPDAPTPINLAQHNYYNLDPAVAIERELSSSGADATGGEITGHSLYVDADEYLAVDSDLIPTGSRESVANSRFDFRNLKQISLQDPLRRGHDHNMVLRAGRDATQPAARLVSADGTTTLSVLTEEPGLQLYTAASLTVPRRGINGRPFVPFGGICLEAQHFPDSANRADFPSIVCTPEQPYHQSLFLNVQHKPA